MIFSVHSVHFVRRTPQGVRGLKLLPTVWGCPLISRTPQGVRGLKQRHQGY